MADKIVRYRAKHNMTQAEFARRCGIDRGTVIRAEKGRKVSRLTEAKIMLIIEEEEE